MEQNLTQNPTVREYLKQARSEKSKTKTTDKQLGIVIGAKYAVKPVLVSDLKVSPTSQRLMKKRHAEDIAKNFNELLYEPLIVSYRDETYYVVDGQNRLYAVKKLYGNNCMVMCKIITGLSSLEEAKLFVDINEKRKALSYADKVKGLYYAKDEKYITLSEICNRNGVELGFENDNRSKKDGRIIAIKALSDTYDKIGAEQTERLVKLLNDTWDGNAEGLSLRMIKALGVILSLYGTELSDEIWVKKLSKIEPTKLISEAKSDLATKTNVPTKIARIAITNYYNKGKGAKPLPYKFGV